MTKLEGILETSLYVTDLERALTFYEAVLGLRQMPDGAFPGGRGAALQVANGPSVLLLFCAEVTLRGGTFPTHGTSGAGMLHSGSRQRSWTRGDRGCESMASRSRRN